jgi:Asp-tRNA(Asn)/Glu-tRNA(Gln) amidotransferase C subunit
MPQITDQELQKLMKLTNIHLDGDDKDKLLDNMDNII